MKFISYPLYGQIAPLTSNFDTQHAFEYNQTSLMKKTLKLFEILIIFNSNMFQEIKKKNFKHVIQKA